MKYLSTRGQSPIAEFEDVLLAGLAPDGGLYVPQEWPLLSADEIASCSSGKYADTAASILSQFTGGVFSEERLHEIASDVYGAFDHPETAPLTQVSDEDWILELYHGPTLAFKDFAMQILGRLFDDVLNKHNKRLTIVAATSGDTGAAAIDALKTCEFVDVVVLHPEGRVTDVQRRMMTTIDAPNVHNIAVKGAFDDCQAIVKEMFADQAFVDAVSLSGVNSINWGRLAAQIVYYFTAANTLMKAREPINFVVPTGNFGDVFAGYVAKKMGLGIDKLVVATNMNDILHRAITTGDYAPAEVLPTYSPSMDIQVASNFERLIFDACDRDSDAVRGLMTEFMTNGKMHLPDNMRSRISDDFISFATSEDVTLEEIKRHYVETGSLIDPHTAVARVAARQLRTDGKLAGKTVTLSTAHPAKFPDAVKKATGQTPALPTAHEGLFDLPEKMMKAPAETSAVKSLIKESITR